ncbi:MAG: hypothetical protein ACYCTL_08140 [Acidimicrobiales bacterium]
MSLVLYEASYTATLSTGEHAFETTGMVTATDTTASSHLTARAIGSSRPLASPFNWQAGATRANLAVVPVGSGGRISIYNYAGSADVVVDVVGWCCRSDRNG